MSCFFDNGDGTVTVTVDVTNANATAVTLDYGPENRIQPGPDDRGQPTVFAAGATSNAWSGTFTTAQLATAKWHLNGNTVSLQPSTECGATDVPAQGGALAVVAFGAVSAIIGAALMGERRRRHRRPPGGRVTPSRRRCTHARGRRCSPLSSSAAPDC